jgi:ribosomal protein S18 acetylase RimI-like enzyme
MANFFRQGTHPIDIDAPSGRLKSRPEREDDREFRFSLFCDSRPELALLPLGGEARIQLLRLQFEAQTRAYKSQFSKARFDIIELDGMAIGRIVVDRTGDRLHLVDIALVPQQRNHGIGTAILGALMAEAREARLPLRLHVATANEAALRLYRRLGFAVVATTPIYLELEWRATAEAPP